MGQSSEIAPRTAWSWNRDQVLLLPPLVLAAVVYFPITRNYFYLDDFLNLYHIVNDSPLRYVLRENGGHVLLVRNVLFYLTFALVGPRPELFYWSEFLTHLVNVALLFLVLQRLTGRAGLASFGAALWGASPLQEGTLGWYSVYGHALVGTMLLIVLAQATRLAGLGQRPSRRQRVLWCVLMLIGVTCFGTGVAMAVALPFTLFLLLPPAARGRWPPLLPLVVLAPLVYVALTRLYEYSSGASAPVRAIARSIFSVLPDAARTFARITGVGVTRWLMGCFYPASFDAAHWYIVLLLFLVVVALCAWRASGLARRQMAGCLLLALACYAVIAIARSILQVAPDTMIASLTRYHYAPTIPLTMLLCLMLRPLVDRLAGTPGVAVLVAAYAGLIVGYAWRGPVIDRHDLEREQTREVLDAIRDAALKEPPGATVRITNVQFKAFPLYVFVPGWAAAFTMFNDSDMVEGRHVVFVESNPNIIRSHGDGRRIGRLLVPPDEPDKRMQKKSPADSTK